MSRPTPQQAEAITATGAVLLAAGAGTGKTATLVNRCLRLVAEEGVDVDRLLVVTFTNAAAAEMKQRLRDSLRELALARPGEHRLQRQLLLLESAHLSTIHSFCLELVRSHFAELALDPGLAVLDESITVPLARQLALDLVRGAIAADADTPALVDHYCGGSGERLVDLILRTHRFYVAQPRADLLLAQALETFGREQPEEWRRLRTSIRAQWLLGMKSRGLAQIPRTLTALKSVRGYGGSTKTADGIRRIEAVLAGVAADLSKRVDDPSEAGVDALIARVAGLGAEDLWVRGTGKTRGFLEGFSNEAELLQSWQPTADGDPLDQDWARVRGPMRRLLELTRDFGEAFTRAKRSLGGVDFADLEQLALRLLIDEHGQPTAVAAEWRERLAHVFVDECQDVNAAQDALLRALARDGERANLFMVGDVKQSIYRFRMAAPELFRNHAESWPDRAHHRVLPLTENFRSREGILAFANDLFDCLMSVRLGGVGYAAGDRLAFGRPDQRPALSMAPPADQGPGGVWNEADCRVELHLVRKERAGNRFEEGGDEDEGWGELLDLERQAHVAAARLRALMDGGHQVWDKRANAFRPMRWSDVGLLMRAVRGRAASFLRIFRRFGIPLAVEQGDFLETLEAADLTALLRVLDNPRQDIPLFAVLRSPLVGWPLGDLATLRVSRTGSDAWDGLREAGRLADAAGDPARRFLFQLERWRRLALMTSLTMVLETVLAETRYEAYLLTLSDGVDRVANVRRFLDLARRFDPLQRQGLYRFLRFLDEQRAAGREIEPLPPRQTEAVQLLSVHRSKGLEFPVVVLAGLGSAFQGADRQSTVLLSRPLGVAPQVVDWAAQRRQDSLPLWRARQEESEASLAEELRLFYVAITRARDSLLLIGSFNPEGKTWMERTSLPPALGVPEARSWCEWVGLWLADRADWCAGRGEVVLPTGQPRARLRWQIHADGGPTEADPAAIGPAGESIQRSVPHDWPGERFTWRYAHETATVLPAKTSATALRRWGLESDDEVAAPWSAGRVFRPARESSSADRLSATEIGIAHHVFLQNLDLAVAGSEAGLRAEAERMRADGRLTEAESGALDLGGLLGFWTGPWGLEVLRHADLVRREFAFTAAFAPAELPGFGLLEPGAAAGDFVVVQGAVDLAVLLPDEIWILDFKTDRIAASEMEDRAREHEPQLRLYARALGRAFGRPVTRCALHFLVPGRTWDLPKAG